jgi:hypothetical protein
MKKQILFLATLLVGSISLFSQVSQGDIQLVQQYFGAEKTAMLNEYMAFTPEQDSVFWNIYKTYEIERQALGSKRITLTDEYINTISNITPEQATKLVDQACELEINFKNLQKRYFHEMAKKIGPVKAAQFYQFETYINNVTNLMIQENIPFVGELEQKHADYH